MDQTTPAKMKLFLNEWGHVAGRLPASYTYFERQNRCPFLKAWVIFNNIFNIFVILLIYFFFFYFLFIMNDRNLKYLLTPRGMFWSKKIPVFGVRFYFFWFKPRAYVEIYRRKVSIMDDRNFEYLLTRAVYILAEKNPRIRGTVKFFCGLNPAPI